MNESHDMMIKGKSKLKIFRIGKRNMACRLFIIMLLSILLLGTGCTASHYRKSADKVADNLIKEKQKQLFGNADGLSIDRPSDTLRRRLMIDQNLQYAGNASLGADKLEKISHWPEKNYPDSGTSSGDDIAVEPGKSLKLTLVQALQVAAMNSSDYQTQKENVFQTALDLNLQRHQYGFSLGGSGTYQYSANDSGGKTSSSDSANPKLSLSKTFTQGAKIMTSVGLNIVNLLTAGLSSRTFVGDASVSIPLLRGSGSYIASEQLTQSERNLIYSLQSFETYKNNFAVQITQGYMNVLSQMDQVNNAAENYKNLITSANRTSKLSEAGRTTIVEVNQALTQELQARDRWISALTMYKNQLDSFKTMLGLPADSNVELDRSDLDSLTKRATEIVAKAGTDTSTPENLVEPGKENASSLEMDETQAVKLALSNRYDLKVLEGKVYDAQRAVIIKADALGTDLTINGTGQFTGAGAVSVQQQSTVGGQSTNTNSIQQTASMRNYTGLLSINLPFDRVSERNAYRKSYIALEQAVRSFQSLEDNIKQSVRQDLRTMAQTREELRIQTMAVSVADTGYKSASMFFEAGRSELRDLLDAQASLLTAKNALTAAVINYRLAELQFQRDAGILKIDNKGLLVEYTSEEDNNVKVQ
jgi:outer membrane protein TolC